jgi:hypothetical protein
MNGVPAKRPDGANGTQRSENDDAVYSIVDGVQAVRNSEAASVRKEFTGIGVTANFTTDAPQESDSLR